MLNALSALSLTDIGRMVGLPRSDAERELQTATSQFALHRDVPTTEVPRLLQDLAEPLEAIRWPRATVIRRAGAARRRTHTVIGAALATAALVASGSLVARARGPRPPASARRRPPTASPSTPPPADHGRGDHRRGGPALPNQMARFGSGLDWARPRPPTTSPATACSRRASASASPTPTASPRSPAPGRARSPGRCATRQGRQAAHPQARRDDAWSRPRSSSSRCRATTTGPRRASPPPRLVRRVHRPPHPAGLHPHRQARGRRAHVLRLRSWGRTPARITVGMARTGNLVVTNVVRSQGRP